MIKYGHSESDVKATVYKYKKGKAKKIGSFYCAHTSFFYDPRGGLTVQGCHMSGEEIYTVKIKNGKLKTTYWRKKGRMVKAASKYMYLPYYLDPHQKGTGIDYSALK